MNLFVFIRLIKMWLTIIYLCRSEKLFKKR